MMILRGHAIPNLWNVLGITYQSHPILLKHFEYYISITSRFGKTFWELHINHNIIIDCKRWYVINTTTWGRFRLQPSSPNLQQHGASGPPWSLIIERKANAQPFQLLPFPNAIYLALTTLHQSSRPHTTLRMMLDKIVHWTNRQYWCHLNAWPPEFRS